MYIITAIPITPIPRPNEQAYSYFFKKPLKRGSLADVPFSNRIVKALVLTSERIGDKKIQVKKASFALKGIKRVAIAEPVMSESEIGFATWISEYFFTSLGLVLKVLLPSYILKNVSAPSANTNKVNSEYRSIDAANPDKFSFDYLAGPSRFKKYVEAIKKNIRNDWQTLIIFPEVLSAKNFFNGLPEDIKAQAIFWARMSPKRELEARIMMLTGETKVVIGTRGSALLHLPELKTIILEDEQNSALKSWDMHPKYDVRPITIHLSQQRGLELIWGGYIPSVNAFRLIKESNKEAKLPFGSSASKKDKISIVDMREEIKTNNKTVLSRKLREELKSLIGTSKQAVLLINRKGEYTVILCRDCGYVLKCSSCGATLVSKAAKDHSHSHLFCRYCLRKEESPDFCPTCRGHRFRFLGAGTQLAEQEIKKSFPSLKTLRLDGETARAPATQERILKDFIESKAQVLLGTQMVIKPNILPKVSLSAIISLETMLYLPEYNGEEKVFMAAVLTKNMGRDKFIWQTYQPEHRLIQFFRKGDYLGFLSDELKLRQRFSWPPFSRIIKISWHDKDKERGKKEAAFLYDKLKKVEEKQIFLYEPYESRTYETGGKYSFNIILKVNPKIPLSRRNKFLSYIPSRWEIDVDTINTLS